MKGYINLIRKAAWSFHQTTGIEWDELFSEASLAYCEAIQSYDPKKGNAKESSWIYTCIENKLKSFIALELRTKNIDEFIKDWATTTEQSPEYEFYAPDRFKDLSQDVRSIVYMVLKNPQDYIIQGNPPKSVFGLLRRDLNSIKGWTWPRVDKGLAALRLELMNVPG